MKVMLTGGAGFIGSHTYVELVKAGHEPIIVDNFYNASKKVIDRLEEITEKPVTYYEVDVCDKKQLSSVFKAHKFDAVIHFAGYKAVGESVVKPLEYYQNNLISTLTLCECMRENKVGNIVFSSSATVYGTSDAMPLTEDMPTGCTSPYGWTKYMIEQILQDISIANKDWAVALLRYFNPVGAHESGKIGEDPVGLPNNLMPFITQVAFGKREKLSVFGNDYPTKDGTGVRDYIHVVDLAIGHVKACEYLANHTGCEKINLGTGIGYSVLDLVNTFQEVNNISVPYQIVERRLGDVARCYADASKAKNLLNWQAVKTLKDMCKDSWYWQSNNPNGYQD